ncbi:hypothetical protein DNU06_10720 [Putridiphycobacter roseus]|uniref:Uncharacterized protein n=1 Tax=Putridiphycobacter roseus TaxID=2219161 RepID=A0A2W1NFD0_9FLAO|nr:hypothetical protein DNU06_10720 [Putridiphycobacter roseus]
MNNRIRNQYDSYQNHLIVLGNFASKSTTILSIVLEFIIPLALLLAILGIKNALGKCNGILNLIS